MYFIRTFMGRTVSANICTSLLEAAREIKTQETSKTWNIKYNPAVRLLWGNGTFSTFCMYSLHFFKKLMLKWVNNACSCKLPTVLVTSKMTPHLLAHLTAKFLGGSFSKVSLKSNYPNWIWEAAFSISVGKKVTGQDAHKWFIKTTFLLEHTRQTPISEQISLLDKFTMLTVKLP